MSWLHVLYAILSLLVTLTALKVLTTNLRHSTIGFRLAFAAVAFGSLSNAVNVFAGLTLTVTPGQWAVCLGLLFVFSGMAWGPNRQSKPV